MLKVSEFSVFGQYIEISGKRCSLALNLVETNTDPDSGIRLCIRIGGPLMRIRKNDADPTGVGSSCAKMTHKNWTTLLFTSAVCSILRVEALTAPYIDFLHGGLGIKKKDSIASK
jgi:hypothetical protein